MEAVTRHLSVLVTGGAGYIGSHIVHHLLDAGHRVVVLDNLYSGHRWAVGEAELVEADLGDGFIAAVRIRHRGIPLCIGSDSNVRIDPLEELRELEGIARRQSGQRNLFGTDDLYAIGGENGARALGLDAWPETVVDLDHRSLVGVEPGDVRAALVAGCSGDAVLGD